MGDFFVDDIYEPDTETQEIVQRYENMMLRKSTDFLEEEEYEIIIEHYLRSNNTPKAYEAADCACRTYPYSSEMKLRRAHTLLARGDIRGAMSLLQSLEYTMVNDPDVFFLKACTYLQLENIKEAQHYFDKAIDEATSESIRYAYEAALELMEVQDYVSAIRYLKRSFEIAPDDKEILNDMAFCFEQLDELDRSEEAYRQYLKESPFNDNAWYNLGVVCGRQKKYEEAVIAFEFSITANANNASAYFNLAMTHMHMLRYDKAVEVFNEFLTKEAESPYTHCLIGECCEQLERFSEARESYYKALEIKNDFSEAYYGIAMASLAMQRLDEAFEAIVAALKIDGENADYWCEYGKLLRAKGLKKDALTAFSKMLECSPQDKEALGYISELQLEITSDENNLGI